MMKKVIVYLILSASWLAIGCPTCTGRVNHNSPAYFSDSFYTPYKLASQPSSSNKNPQQAAQQVSIPLNTAKGTK